MGQVIVDPLELGDACKRRRIYIILIHQRVLRNDIDSDDRLEEVVVATIRSLKITGSPPDPFFGCNNVQPYVVMSKEWKICCHVIPT